MEAIFRRWCAAPLLCLSMSAQAAADDPKIVMEEFMVPAVDPGISLYVRNKHPQGAEKFTGEKILLYVHGATQPAETAFDLKLNGLSWMDYVARHGYDVYLVDVRGYGQSTRPPEMDKPAADNEPIVRTETAVKDVGAAGLHPEAPRRLEDQLAGLVVGNRHHGLVHHAEQRQGEPAGTLRASMDQEHPDAH